MICELWQIIIHYNCLNADQIIRFQYSIIQIKEGLDKNYLRQWTQIKFLNLLDLHLILLFMMNYDPMMRAWVIKPLWCLINQNSNPFTCDVSPYSNPFLSWPNIILPFKIQLLLLFNWKRDNDFFFLAHKLWLRCVCVYTLLIIHDKDLIFLRVFFVWPQFLYSRISHIGT